jgi:hypothetical protein
MNLNAYGFRIWNCGASAAAELHATCVAADESNTQKKFRSESEVMTAMFEDRFENARFEAMNDTVHNDKDRFTATELSALRSDLLQGGMIDSYEAAELLQIFLMGRGYGVSPKAALDAAGRVEMAGCALPVLQFELENLAMVM